MGVNFAMVAATKNLREDRSMYRNTKFRTKFQMLDEDAKARTKLLKEK